MSSFSGRMAKVADKLLNKFDERPSNNKITIIRNSDPVWDPVLGEDVITKGAEISLTGVAVPYSQSLVNGTSIQSGDIKLTITNSTEPSPQDKVLLDGVQYSIVAITPYAYTGKDKTIAYQVQVRR